MRLIKKNEPAAWRKGLLDDYVASGVISLERGKVISKTDIANAPGENPIYSSSVHKNGLFGKYQPFMFDEELITWSVDGGGNFFYRPKHKFSVTNVGGILRINDTARFSYKYLYYLLDWQFKDFKFDYQAKAHPSVIRKMYEIFEPPISEQIKIAEILSSVDQEIQKTDEIISLTGKLKDGLMQELFTKGIGHTKFKKTRSGTIPESWGYVLLDSVAKRGSGHTPNKQHPEYWDGGIKWISLADSKKLDNRYIYTTDKEISALGIDNSSAVLHPKDTVVLSRDAGIGKGAVLGSDMAVSQHFMAWVCGEKLNNWYLYYFLQSRKNEFERIATGTTIKTIGLQYFKDLYIPLPPMEEQVRIANTLFALDDKASVYEKIRTEKITQKKGLMQDLLSGDVRIKICV